MSLHNWVSTIVLGALMVVGADPAVRAESGPRGAMSEAEIRAEFVGRRLAGIYPHGTVWSETVLPDGTTDYLERGNRHAGRWRLEDGLFCFSYPGPIFGGCFEVIRLSPNCYDLYAWSSLVPPGTPKRRLSHNGKMWRADQPATCDDQPSV